MTPEQFDKQFDESLKKYSSEFGDKFKQNISKDVSEIMKKDDFFEKPVDVRVSMISSLIAIGYTSYSIKLMRNIMKDIIATNHEDDLK